MTDNEIIKALECCTDNDINSCDKCPIKIECYTETIDCQKEALDLINRQKAEIERLEGLVTDSFTDKIMIPMMIETAKAEVVKEFAERLKEKSEHFDLEKENFVSETDIDNLVKEMVGEG